MHVMSTPRPIVETSNARNLADTWNFKMQKTVIDSSRRGLSNGTKYTTYGALLEKLSRGKGG